MIIFFTSENSNSERENITISRFKCKMFFLFRAVIVLLSTIVENELYFYFLFDSEYKEIHSTEQLICSVR